MTMPVGKRLWSEQEVDVIMLVADGLSNHEIAREMHLSPHTIKSHLARMVEAAGYKKMTRAGLVGYAFRKGYLQ